MRNFALRLAYDGTHLVGSQWQENGRSVQGEVEAAWTQLTQEHRRFLFSGRTDAGVHAYGQVANVRTETHHSPAVVQRALNALLPPDVAVLDVWEARPDFHARHHAVWRWYRYLIDDGAVELPMLRHCVLHSDRPLDRAAMQAALTTLLGEHDFSAFASVDPNYRTTVRQCSRAVCHTVESPIRPLIAIDLVANAFLRHMVRAIVGTLLLVGHGNMTPAEFEQVLEEKDRRRAGPTAAARGLLLMAVGYTEDRNHENIFTKGF